MAGHNCEGCAFRARYDRNPKSFLGRLWKWHAGWCPRWKAYMRSLPAEERTKLIEKYGFTKFRGITGK